MMDIDKLKAQIVNIVRTEGPIIPIQISRKLGSDTIFAGAVLSELVKNKTIMISHAKFGGSPVYFVSGQERKLEMLLSHLPSKEKEAYELLRSHQVLRDKECEPAIRIALRSIKDFAMPMEIDGELFWRWHLTNEQEAIDLLKMIKPAKIEKKEIKQKEAIKDEFKIDRGDEFLEIVKAYLNEKNVEVSDLFITKKKKEIEGRIGVNSALGKLDYLVLAKNKKKINEADLSLAKDKGSKNKLPVLFLSNGEMTKRCKKYLDEDLRGRVLFRNF